MNNIGLTTVTFRNLSREEICKIADENDARLIEWGGDIHLPPGDKKAEAEVVSLSKRYNLTPLSYGSYFRVGEGSNEEWLNVVDTAYNIGAKIVRVWLGSKSSADVSADEFNSLVEETRRIADIADEKGITVAFEFHKGTYNDCAKSSVNFLKQLAEKMLKHIGSQWQTMRMKKISRQSSHIL